MMKHYYNTVQGWFAPEGAYTTFFEFFKTEPKCIVEVGVYKGKSASYLGVELLNRNWTSVNVNLIDTFEGSPEHNSEQKKDLYNITKENLKPLSDLSLNIIKNDSISASQTFADNSIDFLFLDARHEYEYVLNDIKHWLPKIKKGGVICGDDFNSSWPGVEKAVREIFGNDIKLLMIENRVGVYHWWHEKK